MGEVYGGAYAWHEASAQWQAVVPLCVGPPAHVAQALITDHAASGVLAGNGFDVDADAFSAALATRCNAPVLCVPAVPHALALLRLAPALWAAGKAVAPEAVQPLYIRDKVAQTTAEREAIKAAKARNATAPETP
jgi:tRNA threonylcarbamoyladenosine biosynthesis protein TsaB